MSLKVEVLDKIMGSRKTEAMIKWMKESTEKFLYVTPLLSEVEARLGEDVELDISFPQVCKVHTTKGKSLLELLKGGSNIATTHSMYSQLRDEHLTYIKESGYIVICDEQIETISPVDRVDCLNLLESGNITIDAATGSVLWTGTVLDKYKVFKRKCDSGLVFASKSSTGSYIVTTQLPLKLITAAKRFVLCTYLFQGSVLERFLTLKGIPNVPFTDIPESFFFKVDKIKIRDLITFIGTDIQLKKLKGYGLTTTWWRSADENEVNNISKVIAALGKQYRAPKDKLCWCIPKANVVSVRPENGNKYALVMKQSRYPSGADNDNFEWVDEVENMDDVSPVKVKRKYSEQQIADKRCYLPCNSIATNLYADRNFMLHFQNRYSHMTVKNYLHASGAYLDDDHFALSEFLQWLWRSAIRKGQPIHVCIASVRMRGLFENWLNSEQ